METQVGWVLGPRADKYFFILPQLFALLVSLSGLAYNAEALTIIWLGIGTFDAAHVFSTTPALLNRIYGKRLSRRIFWGVLFFVPPLILGLYTYSQYLFINVLAYSALFHICRQQHGWIMVSRARFREKKYRLIDSLQLLNIVMGPILFWHSPLAHVAKSYFFQDDLVIELPTIVGQIALVVHFAYHLFYLWHFFNRTERNYGKAFIMLMTWTWFFGGLVVDNEGTFFWISLILSHGLPYIYLASKTLKTKVKGLEIVSMRIRWVAFGIFLFVTAASWALTLPPDKNPHILHNPLVWAPLILHYVYDAFIWRRSAFDPIVGV